MVMKTYYIVGYHEETHFLLKSHKLLLLIHGIVKTLIEKQLYIIYYLFSRHWHS